MILKLVHYLPFLSFCVRFWLYVFQSTSYHTPLSSFWLLTAIWAASKLLLLIWHVIQILDSQVRPKVLCLIAENPFFAVSSADPVWLHVGQHLQEHSWNRHVDELCHEGFRCPLMRTEHFVCTNSATRIHRFPSLTTLVWSLHPSCNSQRHRWQNWKSLSVELPSWCWCDLWSPDVCDGTELGVERQ